MSYPAWRGGDGRGTRAEETPALPTFETSIHIHAPRDAVWRVAGTEFADLASWFPDVTSSHIRDDRPPGPGAVRIAELPPGKAIPRVVERITAWDPEESFTYDMEEVPKTIRAWRNTWAFEPEGDGTRVTYTTTLETKGGPFVAWLAWVTQVRKTCDTLLGALKREVEARRASPSAVTPTTA